MIAKNASISPARLYAGRLTMVFTPARVKVIYGIGGGGGGARPRQVGGGRLWISHEKPGEARRRQAIHLSSLHISNRSGRLRAAVRLLRRCAFVKAKIAEIRAAGDSDPFIS